MKAEEIYAIEEKNGHHIHLLKQNLFWCAYDVSAFYFLKLIRPYKISYKMVQKISREFVYLGFPDKILDTIRDETTNAGLKWEQIADEHILITNITPIDGYEEWRTSMLKRAAKIDTEKACMDCGVHHHEPDFPLPDKKHRVSNGNLLLAYRSAYDLALYLVKTASRFERSYRFDLGAEVRSDALLLATTFQLALSELRPLPYLKVYDTITRLRIVLRMLKDVAQLKQHQWLFANQAIEHILELLQLESCDDWTTGESFSESSNPLSMVKMTNE